MIIGGYVNGLGLVRALAARAVRTAVITTRPFDIAHRSRWVSAHDSVPELQERPERLVEVLERRAREWAGWALLPTNDEALAALAEHHDRLSSTYRVIAPPPEVARYFLDKQLMSDVAGEVGVDQPRCYGPALEATADLPQLRFPVLVKPLVSYRFAARFGAKLFMAADRDELRRSIARLAGERIPGLVCDLIPGADSDIYAYCAYVNERGDPVADATVRKLRQGPPLYGDARVAELTETHPAAREATLEILRRIGFRGIAIAEFKRDSRDGILRLIEINGRSVVYNGLLRRGGLDLAGLAWSDHVDGRTEPAPSKSWPGVWINLHADVLYSTLRRRDERVGLRELLRPYARPKTEAVWSARDPRPFVAQWSRTARVGAAALRDGTYRERFRDRSRPAA